MKTTRKLLLLTSCLAACAVHPASALTFSDDFEGATLDPFWTVVGINGSVTFPSTGQVHGGSQSAQLNTTGSAHKEIQLTHNFGELVYGEVSIWFYDSGADVGSSNYLEFYTTGTVGGEFWLRTEDFDLGPANGGRYAYKSPTGNAATAIDRTLAWHHFSINVSASSATMAIDGTPVYSGPGGSGFSAITFNMHAPNFRPAFTSWVDDAEISVQAVPEPSAAALFGLASLALLGRRRGGK